MVWTRDKIVRPKQSDTTGNSRRQAKKGPAEKELDWQHRGEGEQIIRSESSHDTQPAGVERVDGEIHRDAPLRHIAELRDQSKARHVSIEYVICISLHHYGHGERCTCERRTHIANCFCNDSQTVAGLKQDACPLHLQNECMASEVLLHVQWCVLYPFLQE